MTVCNCENPQPSLQFGGRFCSACTGTIPAEKLQSIESQTSPLAEAVDGASKVISSSPHTGRVHLLTTDEFPGLEVSEVLGMVKATGLGWFGTTKQRMADATAAAENEFLASATAQRAHAVLGVEVEVSGIRGFWGFSLVSQTAVVTMTGTAVRLKPAAAS